MTALRVFVDGVALSDEDARSLWRRFSAWMDAHVGDLAGFARAEGFASLHPEMHAGSPVLVASRTAPQRPYAVARKKEAPNAPKGRAGRTGRRKARSRRSREPG
jgi:hypothetical protein